MRVGALQDWPELLNTWATPPETALVKSASSRMTFGDLPPSSWLTRLTVLAARLATSMPARVEPVNEIMSMPSCSLIATPTSGPRPLTRLNTPFGTPAACMTSAKIRAEVGVNSDGFRIMVQPGGDRGRDLAGDLVERPVPRGDHADHTDRLAHDGGRADLLLEVIVLQHLQGRHQVTEAGAGLRTLGHRDRRAHLVGDGGGDVLGRAPCRRR